jgi:hypothetical protein
VTLLVASFQNPPFSRALHPALQQAIHRYMMLFYRYTCLGTMADVPRGGSFSPRVTGSEQSVALLVAGWVGLRFI